MERDRSTARRTIAAVAADLMFGSRIRGAAEQAGVALSFARDAESLAEQAAAADLVLLDLDTRWLDAPALIARLKAGGATAEVPVVAFAAHVNTEAIQAARSAGADRVLARSAFVRLLPELLRGGALPEG